MRKVLRKSCNKLITSLVCGGSRIRTGDLLNANQMLYQLSYTPFIMGAKPPPNPLRPFRLHDFALQSPTPTGRLMPTACRKTKKAGLVSGFFVGPGRVELPTSTLSV